MGGAKGSELISRFSRLEASDSTDNSLNFLTTCLPVLNISPSIEWRLHLIYLLLVTGLFISRIILFQMHFIVQGNFVYMPLTRYRCVPCYFVCLSRSSSVCVAASV